MRPIILTISFLVSAGLWMPVIAQDFYPGNYFYMVAEDGQSFFFKPSSFSPIQTGAFQDIAVSVSDHPLSAINRNPANMNQLSGKGYTYIDVRTLPEENVTQYYGCEVCFMSQLAYIFVPEVTSKKSQEPFLSAALFINPLDSERLKLGFTYQFMQINESYYRRISYPYGFTFMPYIGVLSADSQSPFFGEEDYFKKYGHFPAIYAGYTFSEKLNAALKVSYLNYQGNGTMLSDNFGQADVAPNPQSIIFDRNRHTGYNHWDFSAGMNLQLNNSMDAGLTMGFLTGDFDQAGRELYLQEYLNEEHHNYEDYYFWYDDNLSQRDGFNRHGKTMYGSAEYQWQQHETRSFRFTYRGSLSLQDFEYGLTSTNLGNFESQTLQNSDEKVFQLSEDERENYADGFGELSEWQNQGGLFFTQDFANGFQLRTGLQLMYVSREETALELYKNQFQETRFEQIDEGPLTETRLRQEQNRELDITQNFYEFTGFIPLIVRKSFGSQFSVEAGVLGSRQQNVRKYSRYFEYDNEYVRIEDGITDVETDQSNYRSNERIKNLQAYFNTYGSVVYSPVDQVKLRFMTFTDRRQLNSGSNMEALRFRVSAEFNF